MSLPDFRSSPHYRTKDLIKIQVGRWVYPQASARWLNYIGEHPFLTTGLMRQPKLITKILRPYLHEGLSCGQRVNALIAHYNQVKALGLTGLTNQGLLDKVTLYQGPTKSGEQFGIDLSAGWQGQREGEYCLNLMYKNETLFELNFTLQTHQGHLCLLIGRLQGTSRDDAQQWVRQATTDLHALRPVNVMLHAARNVAFLLGCQSVRMVSNKQRVALNLWRRWRITANYDKTWTEAGAQLASDGFYEIEPLAEKDIDLSEIASKKRAEAKRKQALLNDMYAGLKTFFEEHRDEHTIAA
ncbi:VirK/YbjX family protein [Limnohabitans sp.]